jgi:hypothetical protein
VVAQAVDFSGRGTSVDVGTGAVLEVSAPSVRVEPAGGVVLRDSGTDGRVYYNVLHGADLEQALVAVGASQRITSDPDVFVAGGGLQQLTTGGSLRPASSNALSSVLSVALGATGGVNSGVEHYLDAGDSAMADPGLTLSQRLLAESELSCASGQSVGGTTGVDWWTEDVAV